MNIPSKPRTDNQRSRGAAIVMTVASLVILLGFASFTIDVGYLYGVRLDLQNSVDAAALAGASALPDGEDAVRDRATDLATAHLVDGHPLDLESGDVILGFWDADLARFTPSAGDEDNVPDAVRVIGKLSGERGNAVSLFFAPILGHNVSNVSASATASFGTGQPWNVVIVQDITGSFVDEIDEARTADQALLDCLKDHTSGESQVGIAVFTGYGATLAGMTRLEDGYSSLSSTISGIRPCGQSGMPPCSGTNIGVGIDEGIELLRDLDSELPPAIILVSDGMPNSGIPGYTNEELADWAVQSADEADSLGISVYTLFYGGNDTTPGAAEFLAGLIRGKGTAHSTMDPTQMKDALEEMCREGLPLLLVE